VVRPPGYPPGIDAVEQYRVAQSPIDGREKVTMGRSVEATDFYVAKL